jgi:tRNA-dihydrouridine synthase B
VGIIAEIRQRWLLALKDNKRSWLRLIGPLQLGSKTFPVNIIQGPLAGISCAPFRLLTWQYGQPAFSCTEMISCKTLIYQEQKNQQRFIQKDSAEGPVCFQLASNDPSELAEAVKRVTGWGADLIDLNCGCPVKKIRRKGAGSSLLSDAGKLHQMIHAMKQNTHVPVSIKIRVEGGAEDVFHQEIVKVVKDAGVDFLIVHGRHWTEHYETPCHHDDIEFFVNELTIPVIGNGDIKCVDSLKEMFATGCAGVMISRAGVGQPWLIKKLMAEMQNQSFAIPTREERGKLYLRHVEQLAQLLESEKFALLQARNFAKYYTREFENRQEFCSAVNACESISQLEKICLQYFCSADEM